MSRKVLVAEDEKDILEYLASYIPLLGYEVETAQDGLEALAKVNAFNPELLILDLVMPKMDGFQVLREVAKHNPDMKVLILTGTRTSIPELRQRGADEVLYKPIDLTILSQRINALLPLTEPPPSKTEAEYARLEIVEDEVDIRDYLREFLEPLGIEVYEAANADDGFTLYKEKLPHIVLVDLACPSKEGGYELVQKLATTKDPPPPKTIIIHTGALGDTVEELRRQGYPVFNKPLDLARLRERVLQACQRYGLKLKTGLDR